MRVLGVDPGLVVTGYAVVEWQGVAPRLREAGALRPPRPAPLPARLLALDTDLQGLFAEFTPHALGLESLYSEYRHPRSAIQAAHARGVVCLAAARVGVPVVDIAPSAVKHAVAGAGRASKAQVQRTVQALYHLSTLPAPADVADAIAVATAVLYRVVRAASPPEPR